MLIARKRVWCSVFILGLSPMLAAGSTGSASKFTPAEPANIPGLTLKPGSYSIRVVDHLSERYIVRVDEARGGLHYSFLALANPAIPKPAKPGLVSWDNAAGGKEYLRGWLFPGDSSVLEFVYPKAEAVAIAKSNQAKVPAIDPASEGRPVKIKGLSKSDLELVTLWLLSSTHVGPGDSTGGIQAERYRQVASAERKPVISRLPQTGSTFPLIVILGSFSLLIAMALRVFRPAQVRQARASRLPTSWPQRRE